ncbi:TolC family protein [bacterium]|nr:TolC family protein [bacterium]
MKKVLVILVSFILLSENSYAFGFWFKKRSPTSINSSEKLEYVNLAWWKNFSDKYLSDYIERAVKNNHEAKKASLTVNEYREFVKYQFGQELPSISTGANYYGIHLPKTEAKILYRENVFTIPFTADYQADIFLKNRDKTKSKKKDYEISNFQEKALYISIASEVATTYINIIKYDKQIVLAQRILRVKEENLDREKSKLAFGVTTFLKFNELTKDVETAKISLNNLYSSREKALTQFAVLIGESPENIAEIKRGAFDSFCFCGKIPDVIKSDVIFSRPDVMAEEAKLEKAKIDIRIARKELFPTINVSASYILSNLANQNFFNWNSAIASVMAGLTQELFKGGMRLANLRIYKIKYEEMFENYRQTDLNAVKEVKDSLSFIAQDGKVDSNANNYLWIQKNNYKRVSKKYIKGVIGYQVLLNEREKLVTAESKKTDTRASKLVDYITLYNSVGGKL